MTWFFFKYPENFFQLKKKLYIWRLMTVYVFNLLQQNGIIADCFYIIFIIICINFLSHCDRFELVFEYFRLGWGFGLTKNNLCGVRVGFGMALSRHFMFSSGCNQWFGKAKYTAGKYLFLHVYHDIYPNLLQIPRKSVFSHFAAK